MIFTVAGWTGAQITWTHVSGAATYFVSGDVANPYDVAVALRAWLDDPARPWSGHIANVTLTVEDDGKRHRFRFTFTGGGTLTFSSVTPNATFIGKFGNPGTNPPAVVPASCSATPGSGPWEQWDNEAGQRSRTGGWRSGHPRLSHRQPEVELFLTLDQAYVFGLAIRAAVAPRQAYLYDELAATWRLVTLGRTELRHPEDDYTVMIGTLEVAGGP